MYNRPRIIEIVGLAGAGKSTLVKSMRRRNEEIRIFPLPKSWFYSSLAKRSLLWVPLWFQRRQGSRRFTREELISLGCIDAWLPYIQMKTSLAGDIAILDPGSVYWLAKLQQFGSGSAARSWYRRWWEDKFEQWSAALDLIVWLDAPEELCLQRALTREQWHSVKRMKPEDVLQRFRDLRTSYEDIISKMVSRHSKKVFYFRTDQISTEQIVEQIFSGVDLAPRSPSRSAKLDSLQEASDSSTQPKINDSAIHIGY